MLELGFFGAVLVAVLIWREWSSSAPSSSCKHCGARWYYGGEPYEYNPKTAGLCPSCGKPRAEAEAKSQLNWLGQWKG